MVCVVMAAMGAYARERINMDEGWRFHLGHAADPAKDFSFGMGKPSAKAAQAVGAVRPDFDDGAWRELDLPHDWAIELPFDFSDDPNLMSHGYKPVGWKYPENSIGWYRKAFDLPASDKGKRLTIEFDGVFRDCYVWLNGFCLGRNESGYSSFRYDITPYAEPGRRNVLVVRADVTHSEGWFYEGAGIYRHVWLVKADPLHVKPWGVFVTTPKVEPAKAAVAVEVTLTNQQDAPAEFRVETRILDPDGKCVATKKSGSQDAGAFGEIVIESRISIKHPRLWSPDTPFLYTAVTAVSSGGKVVDSVETPFGIRTFRFDPDKGFILNGERVFLKGVCCHQDHAGVGAALPDALQDFRIRRLKEMGCNAYRASHNPPTPELLEACDRLGMLVMDEHRLVGASEEILGQLQRLILRDRNHPCVVLWSLCNEEPIQGSDVGIRVAATMKRLVNRLDPTRPVTAAMNGAWGKGFTTVVDVQGCNYYKLGSMDDIHKRFPKLPIIGSEEASTLCTRGEYAEDPENCFMVAYDESYPGWGSTAEMWWKYYCERPYVGGAFVWTGFDYRGEPTPYSWPAISSQFGIMDTCGFPKDNFYCYQSWWTDKPMLHLLPHWNWAGREGKEMDVRCFSNCEEVELLLNGKSLGRKAMPRNSHLAWKVPYEPGTLRARGYNRFAQTNRYRLPWVGTLRTRSYNGSEKVAEAQVETTGAPAAIRLVPDRTEIRADGRDAAVFAVEVLDDRGRVVPTANNEIRFQVSANGRIIGVGNGNPSSHEPDRYWDRLNLNAVDVASWKTKSVPEIEDRPETAENFDDKDWREVRVDRQQPQRMAANACAVFRAGVDLTAAQLSCDEVKLCIGSIDDVGRVFVNGKLVGETRDRARNALFEVKDVLKPGRNVIAVAVRNNDGPGGLSAGVKVRMVRAERALWKRKAFNGYCQVIVQAGKEPGRITLKAESEGLRGAALTIDTK